MNKLSKLGVLVLTLGALQQTAAWADDYYQLAWRGTAYTTDSSGAVRARPLSEAEFVRKVAEDNGLDPRTLVFVYRANKRDTAVIRASDGKFIADVIQMEYNYTEAANTSRSVVVRQAFLFDEYHDGALGSAAGMERARRDSNGNLTSFSFRGSFQYATPDNGTVYVGSFSTGRRIQDKTPWD